MGNICIEGFHGTFEVEAEKILRNGFQPQFRNNHWLGQGSYFYTEKKLAYWFISRNAETDYRKKGKGNKKVVIKVLLEEDEKKILDLDSPDGVDLFYYHLKEIFDEFKHVTFSSNEHKNMCTVLDVLSEYFDWNVIVKTFETSNPSYGAVNTRFFDENIFPLNVKYKETQICIRNDKCVKNKEIEYPSGEFAYPELIRFN